MRIPIKSGSFFILNQLMLNSVKYKSENPKVHPYIHIYTERYGHGVRLIVEDNGTGIREEEMSRIFEKRFYRFQMEEMVRNLRGWGFICVDVCVKSLELPSRRNLFVVKARR